jgi:hypothetical protein
MTLRTKATPTQAKKTTRKERKLIPYSFNQGKVNIFDDGCFLMPCCSKDFPKL